MEPLVRKLRLDFPQFSFVSGRALCWSPETQQIIYAIDGEPSGLLHELGHALLDHGHYASDVELLSKEVAAWERALDLGVVYAVEINREHAEDCLDTYRDWLHKRSCCPRCESTGLQDAPKRYRCPNCLHTWQVTAERFCRPYRRSEIQKTGAR